MSNLWAVVQAIVCAVGMFILCRGQLGALRERCSRTVAERFVIGADVISLGALLAAILLGSFVTGVVGLALLAVANFFPGVLVRISGGPRPICAFRTEFLKLFKLLSVRPIDARTLAEVERALSALERFRSSETARTLDAINAAFRAEFPIEADHETTLKAWDEVNAAVAALGNAYRAEKQAS
jgi:hypothetical protein